MLVYGDWSETAEPGSRLTSVARTLEAVRAMPAGLERHSALVTALIETGRLAQGLADAQAGGEEQLNRFLMRLAAATLRSWDSDLQTMGGLPPVPAIDAPDEVTLREPEGFSYYALYPEAYAEAARRLRLRAAPKVIGIRSIGTTLGAIVAAALGAPPPLTVRPFGEPFARRVSLPESVLEGNPHFVIVDEGPGLSGSSFGAVARWLEERDVPLDRIAFLPSHPGNPGPEASDEDRERWKHAQRISAAFDPKWLAHRFGRLERLHRGGQLKFLADHDGRKLLLKFVGLGNLGEQKLEMARALDGTGMSPEPIGLFHGFLAERWHDEGRPLDRADRPVAEIGNYIASRASLFPADDASGASLELLAEMARRNISLAFGQDLSARVPEPAPSGFRRVRTDNRLDRAKWIRLPDGRLLKTDAVDHHRSHDLVGCQNPAWDVAGAIVEFDLDEAETAQLISAAGPAVEPGLIPFFLIAYASFRLGQAVLASGSEQDVDRYRRYLETLLANRPGRTTVDKQQ